MTVRTPHEWSPDALLSKGQRYVTLMLEQSRDEWQFGFWSALSLEMIVRSSIAKVSPALLADAKDWTNIAFALGKAATGAKFKARSIDITEAVSRLEAIFPAFTREMANFCVVHFQRRNAELHSGILAFDELGTAWLPQYYACCEALLSTVDVTLEQFFGAQEAGTAKTLIQALKDDASKAVKGTINAHKTIWDEMEQGDQTRLSEQAETLSTKSVGHRVLCPACNSRALVQGTPAGPESVAMKDGVIVVRQPMLPSHFECKACALKINGYSKLSACDLGETYTSTSYKDPVDYFEDDFRDRFSGMEEDNNEP